VHSLKQTEGKVKLINDQNKRETTNTNRVHANAGAGIVGAMRAKLVKRWRLVLTAAAPKPVLPYMTDLVQHHQREAPVVVCGTV
jgi:hypothetical protein